MSGLKQRHSAETNAKARGYPLGILGGRKQHSNFRSQPIGVATEVLGNHVASDHNSWAILFSGLFLWKINPREIIQFWGENFSKVCWKNSAAHHWLPWDQPFAHGAGLVWFFCLLWASWKSGLNQFMSVFEFSQSAESSSEDEDQGKKRGFLQMFFFRPHPSYHFLNFTHSLKEEMYSCRKQTKLSKWEHIAISFKNASFKAQSL